MKKFFTILAGLSMACALTSCANPSGETSSFYDDNFPNDTSLHEDTLTEDIITEDKMTEETLPEESSESVPTEEQDPFYIVEDHKYNDIDEHQLGNHNNDVYHTFKSSNSKLVISNINLQEFSIEVRGYFLYEVVGEIVFRMSNFNIYQENCSPCDYLSITLKDNILTTQYNIQGSNCDGFLVDSYLYEDRSTEIMSCEKTLNMEIQGNYSYTLF